MLFSNHNPTKNPQGLLTISEYVPAMNEEKEEDEKEEREFQAGRYFTCQMESDGLSREMKDDLSRFDTIFAAHKQEQQEFYKKIDVKELWSDDGRGSKRFSGEEVGHLDYHKWIREKRTEKIEKWSESASKTGLKKGLERLKKRYRESVKNCVKTNYWTECFLTIKQYKDLRKKIIEKINQ